MQKKIKVALMSYAVDGRKAKGTALYAKKLIEGIIDDPRFDFYLVHYEKSSEQFYVNAKEIIMTKVSLPYGSRFVSQLLFFWKYRNNQFDIVHWFQPRVYPFYWLAPAKKIIVTMHGAGDITAPQNFIFSRSVFNFVLKYLNKWVDKVIVVSNDAKKEVVKYYNFSPDRVISIYNGGGENYKVIEKTDALEIVEKKYGIKGSYILDISRFIPHKNVVTLIKAFNEMRIKYISHIEKLVVVGGSSNKNSVEYVLRDKSPFSDDIFFIDYVETEDLNAIYSGADLFVFPSLSEGFGLPVLEAMASGTPVITSNVASMGEIGGMAVITTDPLNIELLAEVIHDTLEDKEKLNHMIELGIERSKEFTWSKMVNKTIDLYLKVLSK